MICDITHICYVDFEKEIDPKYFPLTNKMLEQYDYQKSDVLYVEDYDGLVSICIYEINNDYIDLQLLEVRNDCRKQGIGKRIINELKKIKKTIFVKSISSAEQFYLHEGFSKLIDTKLELKWSIN